MRLEERARRERLYQVAQQRRLRKPRGLGRVGRLSLIVGPVLVVLISAIAFPLGYGYRAGTSFWYLAVASMATVGVVMTVVGGLGLVGWLILDAVLPWLREGEEVDQRVREYRTEQRAIAAARREQARVEAGAVSVVEPTERGSLSLPRNWYE